MTRAFARKSSPRALQRITQRSPSVHLTQALSEAGNMKILPREPPRSSHDLSYRSARTLDVFNANGYRLATHDVTITLQSITAKCIRSKLHPAKPSLNDDFSTLPSEVPSGPISDSFELTSEESKWLDKLGFRTTDVHFWTEILLETRIEVAAQHVFDSTENPSAIGGRHTEVPWFIMNFLLRREDVNAKALRLFLAFAWKVLDTRFHDLKHGKADSNTQIVSSRMIMTLCVRMIRHALTAWPQALPEICSLATTHLLDVRLDINSIRGSALKPSSLSSLAFKCNRILSQVSVPAKIQPVLSSIYQQRAQFNVIRKMMEFQPSLPISREGHRALTKVLLLLKKDSQERDWASLKPRTWPPFKVSKTRFDDAKDKEYGLSKAGRSIEYMQGYGYPMLTWDYIAQVYTGWGPDGSPTVQSRERTPLVPRSKGGEPPDSQLHAAMITSTRTIPEAWAAFLKFDNPYVKEQAPFTAMFRRLLANDVESGGETDSLHRPTKRPGELAHQENVLSAPGDGREISAPPTSPLETMYLPSDPPSAQSLLEEQLARGIPISPHQMSFMVAEAPSFHFGIDVWSAGKIRWFRNDAFIWTSDHLLLLRSENSGYLERMPDLPDDLLAAFVKLLVSFPTAGTSLLAPFREPTWRPKSVRLWDLKTDHVFVYAYRMLLNYRPARSLAWNHVLRALTAGGSLRYILADPPLHSTSMPLVAWSLTVDLINEMDRSSVILDHAGLQYASHTAFNAGLAVRMLGLSRETAAGNVTPLALNASQAEREYEEAKLVMQNGSSFLRRRFINLVGLDKDADVFKKDWQVTHRGIPMHLAIPTPLVLHQYLRALGVFGDHEGILTLVKWMVDSAKSLDELAEASLNGSLRMRRLLVALRVFLECPSRDSMLVKRGIEMASASEDMIMLVTKAVESVEIWDGWATDDEVDQYCAQQEHELKK